MKRKVKFIEKILKVTVFIGLEPESESLKVAVVILKTAKLKSKLTIN